MKMMSPVGFIGIGIMGRGMLKNLLTKIDSNFVIWNRCFLCIHIEIACRNEQTQRTVFVRSSAVCEELYSQYPDKVKIAQSAAEVVQQCGVTYSMLSTMEASIDVVTL